MAVPITAFGLFSVALADPKSGLLVDWNDKFAELVLRDREEAVNVREPGISSALHIETQLWAGLVEKSRLDKEACISLERRLNPDRSSPKGRWVGIRVSVTRTVRQPRALRLGQNSTNSYEPSARAAADGHNLGKIEPLLLLEVNDIDSRRNAEEQFMGIMETSFDGFWDWYVEKDYEYMSPQFWRMFGFEPHEKKPKPSEWQELIFKEDLAKALENYQKHVDSLGEHPYLQEVRYRHRDGSTVYVRCKGRVVEFDESGRPLRMIGTHTDVTALKNKVNEERRLRKVIEEQHRDLCARAEELNNLVHRANSPIIGFDKHGLVTEWNSRMGTLTGVAAAEALGRPLVDFCSVESSAVIHRLLETTRKGEPVTNETLTFKVTEALRAAKPEAPTLVSILLNTTVRSSADGQPLGGYVLGHDLSEVLHAKAKVIQEASKAKAEQALNEYVAHEIRNPIFAASSAAEFLQDRIADLGEPHKALGAGEIEEMRHDVKVVRSSLNFTCELLTSLLDLNRFLEGSLKASTQTVCLRDDVLLPVAGMLEQRVSQGVVVSVECPESLIVHADATRLKQVFINIVGNAVKFTHKGWIKVIASKLDGGVRLVVEDSGPGIPAEKIGDLFQRFSQVAGHDQGSGIGLYLSRLVVARMGGTIFIDPLYKSGVSGFPGSRFVINLPLTEGDALTTTTARPPLQPGSAQLGCHDDQTVTRKRLHPLAGPSSAGAGISQACNASSTHGGELVPATLLALDEDITLLHRTPTSVLIVDDDPTIRMVLSRRLIKLFPSWAISDAISGEEALEKVKSTRFDLILIDEYMPQSGGKLLGTETIKRMRDEGVSSCIIGVSGNDLTERHREVGASHSWQKPVPSNAVIIQDLASLLGSCRRSSKQSRTA